MYAVPYGVPAIARRRSPVGGSALLVGWPGVAEHSGANPSVGTDFAGGHSVVGWCGVAADAIGRRRNGLTHSPLRRKGQLIRLFTATATFWPLADSRLMIPRMTMKALFCQTAM